MTTKASLQGKRVRLDQLGAHKSDASEVLSFATRNKTHLEPWSPPLADNYYTEAYWRNAIEKSIENRANDLSVNFVIRELHDETVIIGSITFSQIVRGAFQACYLGYNLDERRQGKGLMQEALKLATHYAFEELGLHRIMANYRPENTRSAKTLKAVGFVIEGVAQDYLYNGGAWRDHVLTSLTNPDARPGTE